jgi:membrane associated rhomboid family serine protease
VSSGGPDLFVICKNCGSEVSPYITECPYCGSRLRKRAPKLDRDGRPAEPRHRRSPSPSLSRLRRGEIPGIRAESHAYVTIALVAAGLVGCLLWRTGLFPLTDVIARGSLTRHWWRAFTAPFTYSNTGYAFVALTVIAIYGTLLERRHGFIPVIALFLLGGVAGTALSVEASRNLIVLGANGAALALLVAWAIPDLLAQRAHREIDGDLIGTGVLACVVALMPLAAPDASWLSDGVGVLAGVAVGYPLTRVHAH